MQEQLLNLKRPQFDGDGVLMASEPITSAVLRDMLKECGPSPCLFGRHRAVARARPGFVGVVPGLVHKVIHKNCA